MSRDQNLAVLVLKGHMLAPTPTGFLTPYPKRNIVFIREQQDCACFFGQQHQRRLGCGICHWGDKRVGRWYDM